MALCRFRLNLAHELTDSHPQLARSQLSPAWKWREGHDLLFSKPIWIIFRRLGAGEALPGPIDPDPVEMLPIEQSSSRAHTWPFERTRDQVLLAAVRQDVAQPCNLRCFFSADENVLVPAVPERAAPAMKTPGFLG
jgi:hypothetical protein